MRAHDSSNYSSTLENLYEEEKIKLRAEMWTTFKRTSW